MQQRKLGPTGPLVSALGLGCMGMSDFYSTAHDEQEAIATLHRALELGVTLLDTADMYGPHTNEQLIGKAIKGKRQQVFLATKFGIVRDPANPAARGVSSRPEYIRRSVEGSLKRLGVEVIDLYYQHRVDPEVPIEEVVGTMADLISEGKIRYIGLSEASVATLERAHKVHPITALQTEYSLWTRDAEQGVLADESHGESSGGMRNLPISVGNPIFFPFTPGDLGDFVQIALFLDLSRIVDLRHRSVFEKD